MKKIHYHYLGCFFAPKLNIKETACGIQLEINNQFITNNLNEITCQNCLNVTKNHGKGKLYFTKAKSVNYKLKE